MHACGRLARLLLLTNAPSGGTRLLSQILVRATVQPVHACTQHRPWSSTPPAQLPGQLSTVSPLTDNIYTYLRAIHARTALPINADLISRFTALLAELQKQGFTHTHVIRMIQRWSNFVFVLPTNVEVNMHVLARYISCRETLLGVFARSPNHFSRRPESLTRALTRMEYLGFTPAQIGVMLRRLPQMLTYDIFPAVELLTQYMDLAHLRSLMLVQPNIVCSYVTLLDKLHWMEKTLGMTHDEVAKTLRYRPGFHGRSLEACQAVAAWMLEKGVPEDQLVKCIMHNVSLCATSIAKMEQNYTLFCEALGCTREEGAKVILHGGQVFSSQPAYLKQRLEFLKSIKASKEGIVNTPVIHLKFGLYTRLMPRYQFVESRGLLDVFRDPSTKQLVSYRLFYSSDKAFCIRLGVPLEEYTEFARHVGALNKRQGRGLGSVPVDMEDDEKAVA